MRLLRGLHNPGLVAERQYSKAGEESADGVNTRGCVATIGNFDGVHLGHQAIIRQLVTEAKKRDLLSVVVIFEPQPLEFFKGDDAPVRLMRFREKFHALSEFEIDYVFCLKFDAALSSLSASDFIQRILLEHLNVKHLVIGDDFRFGGDRSGDFKLLSEAGVKLGFSVENTATVLSEGTLADCDDDLRVSSTLIRELLAEGDFSAAKNILGRPYSFLGRVIHGQKLGRQLGFPTANVALKRPKSPFSGVYAVSLALTTSSDTFYQGVANVGVKPTVGNFRPSLEVHLFDFDQDIYGQCVQVTFHCKIRDEQRFDGIEALKGQIETDVKIAKAFFSKTRADD
jgi:riboflavin kinase / FMN adenylyltransferase